MRFPFVGRFRPEAASTRPGPVSASSPPEDDPDIPWPSRRAWAYGPPHPPAVPPSRPAPLAPSFSEPERREIPRSWVVAAISVAGAAGLIVAALALRPSTGHAVDSTDTTTSKAATPSSTASGTAHIYALDALAQIHVENERVDPYDANQFPTAQATLNGCDLRSQVLLRDNHGHGPKDGCNVVAGSWTSSYDGVVTSNADALTVDHVVPLKEAWDSGASSWDPARRAAFAADLTDPRTLATVTSITSESKGDRDPANWLPPSKADVCPYIGDWIAIKARWGLSMDKLEAGRIQDLLENDCTGLNITPWAPVPKGQPAVVTTTAAPTTAAPTTTTVAPTTTTATTVKGTPANKKATTTTVEAPDDAPTASPTTAAPPVTTATTSSTTTPVRPNAPTTTTTVQPTTTTTVSSVPEILPGAFCAPVGAHGAYHGVSYICSLTNAAGQPYAGGQPHWRQG
jgi:hypothetical protein